VAEEVRVAFDEVGNEGIWRYGISAWFANEDIALGEVERSTMFVGIFGDAYRCSK